MTISVGTLWTTVCLGLVCLTFQCAVAAPYVQGYGATLESGTEVDAYVIKPSQLVQPTPAGLFPRFRQWIQSRENHRRAYRTLENAAAFVDEQSRASGHVNASTRYFHNRELWQLRNGLWPTVVITERGNPDKVLLTVAIAVPHANEPLPFELRFFKRNVAGLPNGYGGVSIGIQNFFSNDGYLHPVVGFDHEAGSFSIIPDLSIIASMLPWATGDRAEIKFLMQEPGSDRGLASLAHALIVGYGMHRFSAVRLPKFMRDQQVDFLADPVIQSEFRKRIDAAEQERMAVIAEESNTVERNRAAEVTRHFFESFRTEIFSSKGFQKTAAVSTLYAQVSERESQTAGSLTRLFLRRFRFPKTPTYDFIENSAFGTEGIRTRIFALNVENFDLDMMEGLNPVTQELAEQFRLERMSPIGASCPLLLTDFDSRVLLRAHRRYLNKN
jgi:hypothetical protein